jgi:hypothetical protein
MPKIRSAKGEIVDFDLLKIRQTLAQKPVSLDVKAREDFIDKKLRRRIRKAKHAAAVAETDAVVDSPALTNVEVPEAAPLIDAPAPKAEVKPEKKKKQKYRPSSKR